MWHLASYVKNRGATVEEKYNTEREKFPGTIVAGFGGFAPAQLFETESPKEREAPRVAF
jgi:hypothetical protein